MCSVSAEETANVTLPQNLDKSSAFSHNDDKSSFASEVFLVKRPQVQSQKANKRRIQEGSEHIPQKTATQNRWGANMWLEWAKRHNVANFHVAGHVAAPEDLRTCSKDKLGYWLPIFVTEVKRRDGSEYPYNSVYQICCAIKRYLNNYHKSRDMDIFNRADPVFANFNASLDSKMESDTGKCTSTNPRPTSDPITREDEVQLWKSGVVNMNTSLGLSFAVFFYNCKIFNVLGKDEHCALTSDQYRFYYDPDTGHECIEFRGLVGKFSRGMVKRTKNYRECIRHIGDPMHPRCIVAMFKKYLSLIPPGLFYVAPNTAAGSNSLSFATRPVGLNKLKSYLDIMLKLAKINTNGRKITIHSLKPGVYAGDSSDKSCDFLLPHDRLLQVRKSSPYHGPNEYYGSNSDTVMQKTTPLSQYARCRSSSYMFPSDVSPCNSEFSPPPDVKYYRNEYTSMVSVNEAFSRGVGSSEADAHTITSSADKHNGVSNDEELNGDSTDIDMPIVLPSDEISDYSDGLKPRTVNYCMPTVQHKMDHMDNNSHGDMIIPDTHPTSPYMGARLTTSSWTQTPDSCVKHRSAQDLFQEKYEEELPMQVKKVIDYVRNTGGGRIVLEMDGRVISRVQIDL